MLTKFLDFDKIYNFCFNEKIVTQKNLSLQAFVIATLENSFGRSTLGSCFLGPMHAFTKGYFRFFPSVRSSRILGKKGENDAWLTGKALNGPELNPIKIYGAQVD